MGAFLARKAIVCRGVDAAAVVGDVLKEPISKNGRSDFIGPSVAARWATVKKHPVSRILEIGLTRPDLNSARLLPCVDQSPVCLVEEEASKGHHARTSRQTKIHRKVISGTC